MWTQHLLIQWERGQSFITALCLCARIKVRMCEHSLRQVRVCICVSLNKKNRSSRGWERESRDCGHKTSACDLYVSPCVIHASFEKGYNGLLLFLALIFLSLSLSECFIWSNGFIMCTLWRQMSTFHSWHVLWITATCETWNLLPLQPERERELEGCA